MAAKITRAVGRATPTPHTEKLVTQSMYHKGKAFIAAGVLLQAHATSEAQEYVVLHLICQGIEIVLKSILLLIDYKRYLDKLKKPLGHDLKKIADTIIIELKRKPLEPNIISELNSLSPIYKNSILRYATMHDIFIDPKSISYKLVLRKTCAVMRLIERKGRLLP